MTDPLLTKNANIVGVAIAMRRNLKTLICCPSQQTLSVDCAIKDPKQIREAIQTLIDKQYLVMAKDRTQGAKWDHCQYYFKRDWAAQRDLAKQPDFPGDKDLFLFTLANGEKSKKTISRGNNPH